VVTREAPVLRGLGEGRVSTTRLAVRAGAVALAAVTGLTGLTGCAGSSGGGVDELKRAESAVSAKQQALTDAQAELTAKGSAFCTSSAGYITALDRYGDVLHRTATTVGDVRTAGADLTKPREETAASAAAVVTAHEGVVTAQQELVTAEAALAAVKATASGTAPAPAKSPSPSASPAATPAVPDASIARVKQAEADFTAAQNGITDATPLRQAAEQFNAAAVALQMSWLRLFSDAGCLTGEQQKQAAAAVHDYTAALQTSLATAGYYKGEVDGVYGPATVEAVKSLQQANGLPVTGTVDKATDAALQSAVLAKGGAQAQQALASTAAVQQTLKLAGYWTGPVDGKWTPALTEALKDFQTALGVKPTGTVDAATISALEKAIADAGKSSPSPAPTPPPAATATAKPTTTPAGGPSASAKAS
jgi:peptidoglycan hydrolase-like protein with peptidoglycan-binding domain